MRASPAATYPRAHQPRWACARAIVSADLDACLAVQGVIGRVLPCALAAALDWLCAHWSLAPRDVAVEIDRYIAQPGQACAYKIGELTFARLRREAAAALGPKFDVRDFHEVCLDTGALPLAVLEAKVRDWIAAGGSRPDQS
jgi:hypothetical protein